MRGKIMSRDYLLYLEFNKNYKRRDIKNFLIKTWHMDVYYIYKLTNGYFLIEQSASGGEPIEQYMLDLVKLLKKDNFDVNVDSVKAYSLHPDDAIWLEDKK